MTEKWLACIEGAINGWSVVGHLGFFVNSLFYD